MGLYVQQSKKVSVEELRQLRCIKKLVKKSSGQNIEQFTQSVTRNFGKKNLGSKLTAMIAEEVKWYLCRQCNYLGNY